MFYNIIHFYIQYYPFYSKQLHNHAAKEYYWFTSKDK